MEGCSSFQTIFLPKDYKTDFDHRNETKFVLKDNERNRGETGVGNVAACYACFVIPVLKGTTSIV